MQKMNSAINRMETQRVWSQLSTADRVSILGHENEALSPEDSIKLMKIMGGLLFKNKKIR